MKNPNEKGLIARLVVIFILCINCAYPFNANAQTPTKQIETKTAATPQWRPAYHFTPQQTWTNDPNGLFYLNGTYHLFFQNNPFGNVWGHMSWGHATSKDLIHWKHLNVAIPEVVKKDSTISIFSGSAVIDSHNTSGFGKNGQSPIVAIFTGDLPKQKKEAQYIAYSNNTGESFTMYTENPVIDLNRPDFRDPNVFWYAPAKEWIMAVSLVHEHKIRFYHSSNLKSWSKLSDFGPAGYTGHDWECPSLFPLYVDGNASNTKWVLLVSCWGDKGPYMQYFIGTFDGKTFHNDNKDSQICSVDEGDCFYAAIPWRLKQNKQVLLGWLVPGETPTFPWRGQMSIPRDLTLRTTKEGIRLFQQPSSIIREKLNALSGGNSRTLKNVVLGKAAIKLDEKNKYNKNSYWIDATFDLKNAVKVGFNIAQDNITGEKAVVAYDVKNHLLQIDRSAMKDNDKAVKNALLTAELTPVNGKIKIQLLFDRSSLEVFGNDGRKVITAKLYPSKEAHGVSVFSDGDASLQHMTIWDLNNANN